MPKNLDINMDYGRIPPSAIELEEAVLGAMLQEENIIPDVMDILSGQESFYKEAHQKIYQAICDLFVKNKKVDILTVTQQLKENQFLEEVGGPFYITQLASRIGGTSHVQAHAAIVQQQYIRREIIRISSEHGNKAYDDSVDVEDLLAVVAKDSSEISDGLYRQAGEHISDLIEENDEFVKKINSGFKGESMIPIGFSEIDRKLGGFFPGELIIIAGRPSFGKTAFALNIAVNISKNIHVPVGVFSLEMSKQQLVQRLVSAEGSFDNNYFKNPMSNNILQRYIDAKENIAGLDIFVDDNPRVNYVSIINKCRKMVKKFGVKIIFIDYVQLIQGLSGRKNFSRENEISEISRNLKIIAKELAIPIVALAQLNRMVELRTGTKHRPMLSDLRESGALEMDADMVIFLHCPEKYGIKVDDAGNNLQGLTEIIVAKNRNGATFSSYLGFIREYTQFVEKDKMVYNAEDLVESERLDALQKDFDFNLPES